MRNGWLTGKQGGVTMANELGIVYNASVVNALRSLHTAQNLMDISLKRLSTGLRINSAADDYTLIGAVSR